MAEERAPKYGGGATKPDLPASGGGSGAAGPVKGPTQISDPNAGDVPSGGDVFGCTDPLSYNFNPLATIDNGTCSYPEGVRPTDEFGEVISQQEVIEDIFIGHPDVIPKPDTTINEDVITEDLDCKSITDLLCAEGQAVYEDSTSSTGFRSCNDCSEVSPVFHPDSETINGEPLVLIPTNVETEFTGQLHQPMTISFNEQAKGWVAFKTFYPEQALSINNHYYTYSEGSMWQHHINPRRNNFYGVDANSLVDIIFNDVPSSVKGFQTIKYEGTQSRINKFTTVIQDGVSYTDKEYYNLLEKSGWFCSYAETDLQTGKVPEFLNKEGKWFNVIKGDCTTLENLDEQEFSVQGLGYANITHSDPSSLSPEPPREDPIHDAQGGIVRVIVKDSGFDIDGTSWD